MSNFEFLEKLPEKDEKKTLIEIVNSLEQNPFDDKYKHRIREALEILFKGFVLNKKPKKLVEKHLNEFLSSFKKQLKDNEYQRFEVFLIFLWKTGNLNSHSGSDNFKFKSSIIENVSSLKKLHFVFTIILRTYLGLSIKMVAMDETNFVKNFILEHKDKPKTFDKNINSMIIDKEKYELSFSKIGDIFINVLNEAYAIYLSTEFEGSSRKAIYLLKDLIRSGMNQQPYYLNTFYFSKNHDLDFTILGEANNFIYIMILMRAMQEDYKFRNDKSINEPQMNKINQMLKQKRKFTARLTNQQLIDQINDLNTIIYGDATSKEFLFENIITNEVINVFINLKTYLFELNDYDFKLLLEGIFNYCNSCLFIFEEDQNLLKNVDEILKLDENAVFPFEILKRSTFFTEEIAKEIFEDEVRESLADFIKPDSNAIKKNAKKNNKKIREPINEALNSRDEKNGFKQNSHNKVDKVLKPIRITQTMQKTNIFNDLFSKQIDNWKNLLNDVSPKIRKIIVEPLYNSSNDIYGWLIAYMQSKKIHFYHLAHNSMKAQSIFNKDIFEKIHQMFALKKIGPTTIEPHFGFFSKILLSPDQSRIKTFDIQFMQTPIIWKLFDKSVIEMHYFLNDSSFNKNAIKISNLSWYVREDVEFITSRSNKDLSFLQYPEGDQYYQNSKSNRIILYLTEK